jgi:hypothetical protein
MARLRWHMPAAVLLGLIVTHPVHRAAFLPAAALAILLTVLSLERAAREAAERKPREAPQAASREHPNEFEGKEVQNMAEEQRLGAVKQREAQDCRRLVTEVDEEYSDSDNVTPHVLGLPVSTLPMGSRTSRHVTAEDLAGVARTGTLNPLLEAVAAERLGEFDTGKIPRVRTLGHAIFGVPDDATTRTRDVLKDMTNTIKDATAMLEARGQFTTAGIHLATAQKRATLEDAKLDVAIAEQVALKAEQDAAARWTILEDAKLDTAIARQVSLKAQYDAVTRQEESRDEVRETARRYQKQMRKDVRAARHEARRQMREGRRAARERVAGAEAKMRDLLAEMRSRDGRDKARSALDEAKNQAQAAAQTTIDQLKVELEGARRQLVKQGNIDQLKIELEAARRQLAQHDDELANAKRTLELERIKAETQRAQHEQHVAAALLERRVQGALDPDAARRRRAEAQHRRELQRIAEKLQSFTNDAERVAHAKRESNEYVQRAADQHGENSDEHEAALSQAEEFMRALLDKEETQ